MKTLRTHLLRLLARLNDRLKKGLHQLSQSPGISRLAPRIRQGNAAMRAHFARMPRRFYPLLALGVGAIGMVVAVAIGSTLYLSCGLQGCPDVRQLDAWQPGGAPMLLDRNGVHFADLAPYERVIVQLDSLPEHLPAAFIAVEDQRFWDHRGIDWVRVAGAAIANLRARTVTQGSSTISMQLARNVFPQELPGAERTFRRKFREIRVARLIEHRFEKREILEMYLNHIYFGGGAYGIEAAASLYFDKPAAELTLAESATLAALPKAPAHYDPRRRADESRARRNLVLGLMERAEMITSEEAQDARESEVVVAEGTGSLGLFAGYFLDVVRDLLEDEFGTQLYSNQLRIHTTLDRATQAAAERELEGQLRAVQARSSAPDKPLQGSVVVLDAHTGGVRALVGGRSPATSRYNRAILARRQLGSAFKPFVFAAAIGEGVPTSRILVDIPIRMDVPGNDVWVPANYDGQFEGEVSLRNALVHSRNIPTVRLASAVGIGDVARTARTAGVRATMDETPSLALGTVATSPLEVATAYTTFATLGYTSEPHFILRVEDSEGGVVWEPPIAPPTQTMDPRVAYIVTDILRDVVDRGTGTGVRSAGYRGVAAGKTGTTNDATDAWFIGFTPHVVGAVWIGYDEPTSLGSTATGGGLAAPIWGRIMQQAHPTGTAEVSWSVPSGIVERTVDTRSGLLLADGCRAGIDDSHSEIFLTEHLPDSTCPSRGLLNRLWNGIRGTAARIVAPERAAPMP